MIPTVVLPFSFQRKIQYIPVDSLHQVDIKSNIILKLKNDSITLRMNNKNMIFIPKYIADSITFIRNDVYPFLLSVKNENINIHLTVGKLLSMDSDSMYFSATYQEFNMKKGYNESKIYSINNISISRNDLEGIAFLPPFTGVEKKKRNLFVGIIGVLGLGIAIFSTLAN